MASFDSYFSVLALFILFRETIEASIICGVLLQFLNRSKPALKKAVWYGVAAGVGVSIIFGIIFIAVFYTAKNSLFSGKNRDWFKGIISWIAALLIAILGFAMLRFLGWEAKWKRKLAAAIAEKVPDVVVPAGSDPAAKPTDDAVGAAAVSSSGSDDVTRGQEAQPPPTEPQSRASATQHQPSHLTSPTLTTTSSSSGSASANTPGAAANAAAGTAADAASGKSADVDALKRAVAAEKIDLDVEAAPKALVKSSSSSSAAAAAAGLELSPSAAAAADLDPCDRSPATRRENLNIFFLVFTTVVREGIESVVFLGGLGNVKLSAVPLPAFVGIVCGVLVGVFLYYSGKQVKHIKWLVIIMAIIILFIAAGQVSIGTDALMRAGAFGECSPWLDERPWYMKPMADFSRCCSDTDPNGSEPTAVQNRKRFFALARAIFGYQDKPTPVEIIAYCCFWGLVLIIMAWKAWRGTLLDADYKHTREVKRAEKEAARRAREEEEARATEAVALEGGRGAVVGLGAGPVTRAASRWSCGGGGWRLCFAKSKAAQ